METLAVRFEGGRAAPAIAAVETATMAVMRNVIYFSSCRPTELMQIHASRNLIVSRTKVNARPLLPALVRHSSDRS